MNESLADRKRRRYTRCDRCRHARRACDGATRAVHASLPNVIGIQSYSCSRCLRLRTTCSLAELGKTYPKYPSPATNHHENQTYLTNCINEYQAIASDYMLQAPDCRVINAQISESQVSLAYPVLSMAEEPDATMTNQLLDVGLPSYVQNDTSVSITLMDGPSYDYASIPLMNMVPESTISKSVPEMSQAPEPIATNPLSQTPKWPFCAEINDKRAPTPNIVPQVHVTQDQSFMDSTQIPSPPMTEIGSETFIPPLAHIEKYTQQQSLPLHQPEPEKQGHSADFKFCSLDCDSEDCPWRLETQRQFSVPTTASVSPQGSNARKSQQQPPSITLNDITLAQANSKSMVISLLMHVYQGAMENALQCWSTKYSCPYETATVDSSAARTWAKSSGPFLEISFCSRSHALDRSLSRFRKTPLTKEEDSAATKALKLSTMAFGSQWRRNPINSAQNRHASPFPPRQHQHQGSNSISSDSPNFPDFDNRLRASLWNQAKNYLDRRLEYNTFRDIFARLLFTMIQRPPQDHTSSTKPGNLPDDRRSFEYVTHAIQQMLCWKQRILSKPTSRSSNMQVSPTETLTIEEARNFKLLFWIAIMVDTTSSVLTNKPFIIPEQECGLEFTIQASNQPRKLTRNDLTSYDSPTGSFPASTLCFSNTPILNLGNFESQSWINSSTLVLDEVQRRLQNAIPVKILLWRKLGALQKVLSTKPSPCEVENFIKDALNVYEYWSNTYREFLSDCVTYHSQLTFQMQSWYTLLICHWHLPCLKMAQCIDEIDAMGLSSSLQRALRRSSALTWEVKMDSASSIAALTRISNSGDGISSMACDSKSQFSPALKSSALLTEPWTDIMILAFSTAGVVLSNWLSVWSLEVPVGCRNVNPEQLWLHGKAQRNELESLCVGSIQGLSVLGDLSNTAKLAATEIAEKLQHSYTLR